MSENSAPTIVRAAFNDRDKGDDLTFKIDTTGTSGTVVNNGDGTFLYDVGRSFEHLPEGERAYDTFPYTVSDGRGGADTKTVTVSVVGKNDAPIAFGVGVMTTASPSAGEVRLEAVLFDPDRNDRHTFGLDASGLVGQVVNNGDGTFTYSQDARFDHLGEGETAYDTFTYTVTDRHGAAASAPMVVIVEGRNDAPVFETHFERATLAETPGSTGSEAVLRAEGMLAASDKDQSDHPPVTLFGLSFEAKVADGADLPLTAEQVERLYSSFSLDIDGKWTFAAQDRNFDFLAPGDTLTLTANLLVEDRHGAADHATVEIFISGSDEPMVTTGLADGSWWHL